MRTSSVCLILGLLLMGMLDTEAQPHAAPVPSVCCFDFIGFKIPPEKIKSKLSTSSNCPTKAIVVKTVKGYEFCVKPDESWLQEVKDI